MTRPLEYLAKGLRALQALYGGQPKTKQRFRRGLSHVIKPALLEPPGRQAEIWILSNDAHYCQALRAAAGRKCKVRRVGYRQNPVANLRDLPAVDGATLLLDPQEPTDGVYLAQTARERGWNKVIVIGEEQYHLAYVALRHGGASSYWVKTVDPGRLRLQLARDT